ncbi:hypothetical protein [Ekhidna sp.]|uniref:hypothetical protein n=1 Tax=Ekhidna sp. TaxID=2608089 RepID=UPI0032968AE8
MQRFKLIFHIIYVIIAVVIMYFSVDILLHTEQYLSKIKLSSYIKFPRYVMGLFLFISILMMVEFVLQQLKIHSIKNGVADLKDEIVDLKAKLYDKSQEDQVISPDEDEESQVEEDED